MAQDTTESGKVDRDEAATPAAGADPAQAKTESRDEIAARIVDRYTLWGGGAGLIPIPLLDIATVAGVQLQMLRRLSENYGVQFSDNLGKSVIASLAGSLIPATSGAGIASALKFVPVIGAPMGALMMPALSAGATYAIGKVFIQHFASGGTLLDFNPPDYREFFKAQRDKWMRRSDGSSTTTAPSSPGNSSTS